LESGNIKKNGKIAKRKDEHILNSLEYDVQCSTPSGFDDVTFIHSSLPEINFNDIDTSFEMFGRSLDYPLIISAITGGSKNAGKVNEDLARVAQKYNIGISVGSQRAMLEDAALRPTYEIRKYAPDALLFSNIGIAQLITMENDQVEELLDSIGADVLAVHLNPLQEVLQPEGDTDFKGGTKRLKELKKSLSYPLIVKETGAGISSEVAQGLRFLDGAEVAGVGGTSFAAVEYYRTSENIQKEIAMKFWDWGIPTVCSIVEASEIFDTVIASGGIRSGIHIAKSLALGASCAGIAYPFLAATYKKKIENASIYVDSLIRELKITMFLVGAGSLSDISTKSLVFSGKTRDYLVDRGFSPEYFARKGEK